MPDHRTQPARLPHRSEREHPDRVLAALVIRVEHLDREHARSADGLHEGGVLRILRIADGGLPEADVAAGNIEVPPLRPELVGLRVRMRFAEGL